MEYLKLAFNSAKQDDWDNYYKNLIIAAHRGSESAVRLLDYSYSNDIGKENWSDDLITFYEVASIEGNSYAQCHLGCVYEQRGDYHRAIDLYRKSAKQDNPFAFDDLGRIYEKGKGVEQNNRLACYFYLVSASKGYSIGMYNAARMLIYHEKINYPLALHLLMGAVEKQNKDAIKLLKKFLEQNKDVIKLLEELFDQNKKFLKEFCDQNISKNNCKL